MSKTAIQYKKINSFLNICLKATEHNPVIFFVGSGVSTGYPSILPSAYDIVKETIDTLYPAWQTDANQQAFEKEKLSWILPEIYYGNITSILGYEPLNIWKLLNFWKNDNELKKFSLGPNSGHYAMVYIAWKSKAPIITTNFDTLLEEAATQLGLKTKVSTPTKGSYIVNNNNKTVSIWKVHGSIHENSCKSLKTTIRTISSVDFSKLESIKEQFFRPNANVCFIGYSGRDIDLFPFLSSWQLQKQIYWVDWKFSNEHKIYTNSQNFFAIQNSSNEFAEKFVKEISAKISHPDKTTKKLISHGTIPGNKLIEDKAKKLYIEKTKEHIRNIFAKCLNANDNRINFIHASSLHSIGLQKISNNYINKFIEISPRGKKQAHLFVRAYLLKVSTYHGLSKYKDSEISAKTALYLSKLFQFPDLVDESYIAIDEALRMQYLPRLNYKEKNLVLRPYNWLLLIRFFFRAIKLVNMQKNLQNPYTYDEYQRKFVYLEHIVRLVGSIQDVFSRILPKKLCRLLFTKYWNYIEDQSLKYGFANGIGYSRRYAERIGIQSKNSKNISSQNIFNFLGEKTGMGIAIRDQGELLLESIKHEKDPSEKQKLIRKARNLFTESYEKAFTSGNYSIALKSLINQKRLDSSYKIPISKVTFLLTEIQGKGYQDIQKDIINWFGK